VAELRPLDDARAEPRPIGPLEGRPRFDVPATFFEPLPDADLDAWDHMLASDPLAARVRPVRGQRASRVAEGRTRHGAAPARTRKPRR
jgi:hypothetical protein